MCGDLESDETLLEEFYARFVENARAFVADEANGSHAEDANPLYRYLDERFREALTMAADQDAAPADTSGYERLCMEPLVFARIAGFMAAHQPLEDDPMRRLMEAVMTGYAEGEDAIERYAHQHAPENGHAHDNGHGHTH